MDMILRQDMQGFAGVATREEVDNLNKALTAGYSYAGAPSGLVGGGAMMMESLEASLKSTTWQMKNLVMWPSIPVDKAYNTVEQYRRITSYGGNGSPYFTEGGSPREDDSVYNSETQKVVYMGTRRKVSHPMMLVRVAFGDAVAREVNNGNMWLLQRIERELYHANDYYVNTGDGTIDGNLAMIPTASLSMNGLSQQIRAGEVDYKAQAQAMVGYAGTASVRKSLADDVLEEEDLEDGAVSIFNNFGVASEMHMAPAQLRDLSKQFFIKERIPNMGVADGRAGFVLREFVSSAGTFGLKSNVFLNAKSEYLSSGEAGCPTLGTLSAATANGGAAVASGFALGDTFFWRVAPCNMFGEATSVATVVDTVTLANEGFVLTITHGTVSADCTHFAVYRTDTAGLATTAKFLFYVRRSVGAATTVCLDYNRRLPGRNEAYMLFFDPESLVFKQLSPLAKINLATVAAAFEWLQVLYGCLIVFTPRKHFLFENVGIS